MKIVLGESNGGGGGGRGRHRFLGGPFSPGMAWTAIEEAVLQKAKADVRNRSVWATALAAAILFMAGGIFGMVMSLDGTAVLQVTLMATLFSLVASAGFNNVKGSKELVRVLEERKAGEVGGAR